MRLLITHVRVAPTPRAVLPAALAIPSQRAVHLKAEH